MTPPAGSQDNAHARKIGAHWLSSIRTSIFLGFIVVSIVTSLLGGYGYFALSSVAGIVAETYDRPMMAINYARSADLTFVQMQEASLRERLDPTMRAQTESAIVTMAKSAAGDLKVAKQRSMGDEERKLIDQIDELQAEWLQTRTGETADHDKILAALADQVEAKFDLLIELTTDHSFIERRDSVRTSRRFVMLILIATGAALTLSVGITLFLARRILNPLSAAVRVADRIGAGDLQTPIPTGGADEIGTLLRSMTVMQDRILEMMAREQAQRQSAQGRLIDAVESLDQAVVLLDEVGGVVLANSRFGALLPWLTGPLKQKLDIATIGDYLASRPDLSLPDEIDLSPLLTIQDELKLPDGSWIRPSLSTTRDGGAFVLLNDITTLKQREELYREAKLQAEAASAAKSSFIGNMSHELRTPLNAIIGFSELFTREAFGPLGDSKYSSYAADVLRGGKRLLKIVNTVLEFSSYQGRPLSAEAYEIDIRELVDDRARRHKRVAAERGIPLTWSFGDDELAVLMDETTLGRALDEIIGNAILFTEAGNITVAADRDQSWARIRVTDTGIGMAAADIATALSPFGQIDCRLARATEGIGLGLPLAKVVIEMHRGQLLIASVPGTGTVVTVLLPLAAAAANAAMPSAQVA